MIESIKCHRGLAARWANPCDPTTEIIVMAESPNALDALWKRLWPNQGPRDPSKSVTAVLFSEQHLLVGKP